MSETENYHLHLTDGNTETFVEWRNKINGPKDSNMQKIDQALCEKADNSIDVRSTLLASAWSGSEAPFTQVLAIEKLTEDRNGIISIAQNATIEQRNAARCAMLSLVGQSDGELVIAADGDIPEVDIPIILVLFG